MSGNQGLTLIEGLVVLGISALLLGLASFSITGSLNRINANSEVIKMRDVLWRARNLAVVGRQCVTVTVAARAVTLNSYNVTANCAGPFVNPTYTNTTNFAS